jgi:hypothetical protein
MFVVIPVLTENGVEAVAKPGQVVCPHLSFSEEGQASCAVHDLPEYEESPCHIYGNSDYDPDFLPKRGKPCPVGSLYRSTPSVDVCAGAKRVELSSLESLGPWKGLALEEEAFGNEQ